LELNGFKAKSVIFVIIALNNGFESVICNHLRS